MFTRDASNFPSDHLWIKDRNQGRKASKRLVWENRKTSLPKEMHRLGLEFDLEGVLASLKLGKGLFKLETYDFLKSEMTVSGSMEWTHSRNIFLAPIPPPVPDWPI